MESKANKAGFFNMDTVTAVCAEKDLNNAKKIAVDQVNKTKQHATPENVNKALNMIDKAKSVKNLGIAITNFMFAHPSENLKAIR